MWGQSLKEKDEGKVQGALSLWRKSARDFHRPDEEAPTADETLTKTQSHGDGSGGNEGMIENHTPMMLGEYDSETEGNNSSSYLSEGDFPTSMDSRQRKRRGSVTRRR
jgi:hypothetical protein